MNSSHNRRQENDLLLPFEQQALPSPYRQHLCTKRNNYFASIQEFPAVWRCFQLLDKIWMRGLSNLEYPGDMHRLLPLMLFQHAHAQFRIALELGFSGCTVEAANILRAGIEFVAHSRKIHSQPQLAAVWLSKNEGHEGSNAFKQDFEDNKRDSVFPQELGLRPLYDYW